MSRKGQKFSPERLMKIRRLRKARRLYKLEPAFALINLQREYPDYTQEQFWDDLRRRSRPKKKKGKSPLTRFGRYRRMQSLLARYLTTKDESLIRQAETLRLHMTKPYRVLVRIKGLTREFQISALTPIERVEMLTQQFRECTSDQEIETLYNEFLNTTGYGN